MIIPGKNNPEGTLVPYVIIVKRYHPAKKTIIFFVIISTFLLIIFRIIEPSVFQKSVARGL